ncbi:hypothetical protein Hanom_Chr04g00365711 [Helianthus anomalus]
MGDHLEGDLGDSEVDDVVILDIPSPAISVVDISSDSGLHYVADSFESVTSSALHAVGVRAYATDLDSEDAMLAALSSPVHAPTPPLVHDHILDLVSAPLDLPPMAPPVSQPPPTVFVPPLFATDAHRTDLPIIFQHEIPAPCPGEGTSGQPLSFDPFASSDFPPILQFTPFETDTHGQSTSWFPPYTMPISDPYHPSHHVGCRVLELEFQESAKQPPLPSYPPPVPQPPPSIPPSVFPSAAPNTIEGFDARFLTAEQHISFLVRRVHELEDELTHVSLDFPKKFWFFFYPFPQFSERHFGHFAHLPTSPTLPLSLFLLYFPF